MINIIRTDIILKRMHIYPIIRKSPSAIACFFFMALTARADMPVSPIIMLTHIAIDFIDSFVFIKPSAHNAIKIIRYI